MTFRKALTITGIGVILGVIAAIAICTWMGFGVVLPFLPAGALMAMVVLVICVWLFIAGSLYLSEQRKTIK
jgi:membrane protein YdbS with pleckstrin-like domain